MPNTASAKKALRQGDRRREKNLAGMKDLKTVIKTFRKAPSAGALSIVYKKLDKAAKVNLIKKNAAGRMKSRLSKLLKV
ncbi:MAG: 30S ribosomal protein S20 [Patescibacteria group bacterium]